MEILDTELIRVRCPSCGGHNLITLGPFGNFQVVHVSGKEQLIFEKKKTE